MPRVRSSVRLRPAGGAAGPWVGPAPRGRALRGHLERHLDKVPGEPPRFRHR